MRQGVCAAGLALVALVGCYPVTGLQVPRTVAPGRVNVALSVGIPLVRNGGSSPEETTIDTRTSQAEAALRVGLTDWMDVGIRGRATAIEVGPKFQLLRDVVEVSIAPSFIHAQDSDGFIDEAFTNDMTVRALRTSVYVGSSMDHKVSVFVAPTIDLGRRSAGSHSYALVMPGVMTGVVFSPRPAVHFLIELGMLVPSGPAAPAADHWTDEWGDRLGPGDTRVELGLGVLFGRFSERFGDGPR